MDRLRNEWNIFLCALLFFTRLPVRLKGDFSADLQSRSAFYLPVVGWVVAAVSGLIFLLANALLPQSVSIVLSIISGVVLTGAFHEDGFSDSCDGLGGGWSKAKVLDIMKDSRVGAFGLIGTILLLFLKLESLKSFKAEDIFIVLFVAHSYSRFVAYSFMYTHQYARLDESSKSRGVVSLPAKSRLLVAFLLAVLPLFVYGDWKSIFVLLLLFIGKQLFGHYLNRKIGGYTGDVLGAVQQVSECILYLGLLVIQSL